jgi:hypothetical protein
MQRKLIPQGKGGLTIYLPRAWLAERRLGAGDEVMITESAGALSIHSEKEGSRAIEIDITAENRHDLRPLLTHLYRTGFDRITVRYTKADVLAEARDLTNRLLLGFEVTAKDDGRLVLENISEPASAQYEVLERRIFLLIKELHKTAHDGLASGHYAPTAEVRDMLDQGDRCTLFCRRLLAKGKYLSTVELEWELLTLWSMLAHTLGYLFDYASKRQLQANEQILDYVRVLGAQLDLLSNAYFKEDLRSLHAINAQKRKYQFGSILESIEHSEGGESVLLAYVRELFRLLQFATSPVLSQIVDHQVAFSRQVPQPSTRMPPRPPR